MGVAERGGHGLGNEGVNKKGDDALVDVMPETVCVQSSGATAASQHMLSCYWLADFWHTLSQEHFLARICRDGCRAM